jgi:hypothetical protein
MTDLPTTHPTPDRPLQDHERSDVATSSIVRSGIGLIATTVMVGLLTFGLYRFFVERDVPAGTPPSLESLLPAQPRLQSDPAADLEAMRAEEDRLITSYRWLDQKAGIARIPVARAMKLLVERGLPVKSEPVSPAPVDPAGAGAGTPTSQPPAVPETPSPGPERSSR